MKSQSLEDHSEEDEDNPVAREQTRLITAVLLPTTGDPTAQEESKRASKFKRFVTMPMFSLRRKAPSVSDSLAVVGLRKALLVGMLSNLGEDKDEDQDGESESSCQGDESSLAPSEKDSQPIGHDDTEVESLSKGISGIGTDSSNTVNTSSSSHHSPNHKKTRRARSIVRQHSRISNGEFAPVHPEMGRQSSSDESNLEIGATAYRASMRRGRANSTPRSLPIDIEPEDSSPADGSSPDSSFATMMFARDAVKITAKDLLKIPLTVPSDWGTPPPTARYTNSGLEQHQQRKKRFVQKGRMSASMDHSHLKRYHEDLVVSSNDTLHETDSDPGKVPGILAPRRTSYHPLRPLPALGRDLMGARRNSEQPARMNFRRTSNVTFARSTDLGGSGSDVRFQKASSLHIPDECREGKMSSDFSSSLPSVSRFPGRQPFRSVYANYLTVPDPYGVTEVIRSGGERGNRLLQRQNSFDRSDEGAGEPFGAQRCAKCSKNVVGLGDWRPDFYQGRVDKCGIMKQSVVALDGRVTHTNANVKVTDL